jgi:hypothetical protein
MIIHHIGKVVSGHPVAFEKYFIVQLPSMDADPSPNLIIKAHFSISGYKEADYIRLLFESLLYLFGG